MKKVSNAKAQRFFAKDAKINQDFFSCIINSKHLLAFFPCFSFSRPIISIIICAQPQYYY